MINRQELDDCGQAFNESVNDERIPPLGRLEIAVSYIRSMEKHHDFLLGLIIGARSIQADADYYLESSLRCRPMKAGA